MKYKMLSSVILFALSQTVFANIQNKPASCPTLSSIKSVGINEAYLLNNMWMFFIKQNNFGTKEQWTFIMEGALPTHDKAQAIAEANARLSGLKFANGPEKTDTSGRESYSCGYLPEGQPDQHGIFFAVAITPPVELPDMKQILKKMAG
ncbi:MAG TPA: hypothetical protein VL360_00345 [Gammaproteobacteria bacterium]|jgi:hypothetical protein|nr:hypothetical protein [Gammaproteobacteria bacterium]